ncbi:hypothetical protein HBI81_194370 [Parastagonospora nodorum]|nr:hypothetical protein HBI03_203020 [Parastagonospora nodorum]KAH4263300.1 hypothetical protein HBI04_192670 [Parastagonospora nodorum]KAH5207862.1 hypothetical protein HBH68_086750 [Parastagonospora nodorum]KAH5241402.1 hypothetical protein HBI72_204950 [Parastagonospora nodorum]KAH5337427.1 hypothetical protein HBI50_021790 [Parastagonospora nodorum]
MGSFLHRKWRHLGSDCFTSFPFTYFSFSFPCWFLPFIPSPSVDCQCLLCTRFPLIFPLSLSSRFIFSARVTHLHIWYLRRRTHLAMWIGRRLGDTCIGSSSLEGTELFGFFLSFLILISTRFATSTCVHFYDNNMLCNGAGSCSGMISAQEAQTPACLPKRPPCTSSLRAQNSRNTCAHLKPQRLTTPAPQTLRTSRV